MNRKYELLKDEGITHNGRTLYRIRALKDFGQVKAGDLGGYIEHEDNLSPEGTCWVADGAQVYDHAWVCQNAQVYDKARLLDRAMVSGRAHVCGEAWLSNCVGVIDDARVDGRATLRGHVHVGGHAHVSGQVFLCDKVQVSGHARLCGAVRIIDDARIGGQARIDSQRDVLWFPYCGAKSETLTVYRGLEGLEAFYWAYPQPIQGPADAFLAAIESQYGDACFTRECRAVIEMARARMVGVSAQEPAPLAG